MKNGKHSGKAHTATPNYAVNIPKKHKKVKGFGGFFHRKNAHLPQKKGTAYIFPPAAKNRAERKGRK
jgi:O-glycosyl hydrolase